MGNEVTPITWGQKRGNKTAQQGSSGGALVEHQGSTKEAPREYQGERHSKGARTADTLCEKRKEITLNNDNYSKNSKNNYNKNNNINNNNNNNINGIDPCKEEGVGRGKC